VTCITLRIAVSASCVIDANRHLCSGPSVSRATG
jgi:hypothetical protein